MPRHSAYIAVLVLLIAGLAFGQQVPNLLEDQIFPDLLVYSRANPPLAFSPAPVSEVPPHRAVSHQRMLGIFPAFGVTDLQDAPALTGTQKFTLAASEAFDPFEWVTVGLENFSSEEGHGVSRFGRRYSLALATDASGIFIRGYVYPTLFKQDPRYFRVGEGSVKGRILRSMEQEFWTRSDSGTHQFNYSGMLGALTTSAIPNAYIAPEDRGLGSTLGRCATGLVLDMANQLGAEFWPDIDRHFFHKHQKETTQP